MEVWVRKTAIVIFCLWHMTALGVYALSSDWPYPFLRTIKDTVQPHITWYVQLTSQWQKWNLFSPDPLRRVTEFSVEYQSNGRWMTGQKFGMDVEAHRRASILKTIRRLESNENAKARVRLLEISCRDLGLPVGTPMRLRSHSYVIPKPSMPMSTAWWAQQQPRWQWTVLTEMSCPDVIP